MKTRSAGILLIIILLISGIAYVALEGITIGSVTVDSIGDSINLGLDIEGGVVIVYEAQTDATGSELDTIMQQTRQVLSQRIDGLGLVEPNVTIVGDDRIRIEMPGVSNAQEAIDVIGQTAKLEFHLITGELPAIAGFPIDMFESELILTGENVKDAYLTFDEYSRPSIGLEFDSTGATLFRDATQKATQMPGGSGQIAIVLDGEVISAPYTNVVISNGEAIITGSFSVEEANNLAMLIRGGALPVELIEVQSSVVGPTLGLDALNSALKAAVLGFSLVIIFMIVFYRVPGLIASIALVLYTCILLFVMVAFNATLTLPGIAGIVLSLGMAVDANIIIFERIKEELKNGKTLRSSVESGFHRALRTIMDANITTFIAAIILYVIGQGPIRGFAVTLMIGIITSMFTSIVVTRQMLKLSSDIFTSKKLYGYKGGNA